MQKYTFLFINITDFTDFLSIAMRVKSEGYPIYFYKKTIKNDAGIGLFSPTEIINDYWKIINTVPKEQLLILLDDNGEGEMADFLRKQGYLVIGGSAFADKIEYERGLGTSVMKKIGLSIPTEHKFNNFSQAISFLESQKDDVRFVFKPDGDELAGSSKTYTGKNKQDMIDYIRWIETDCKAHHYAVDKFLLQEFIPGEEADFSAYFNGENFVENILLLDIEEKKSGDGNRGEATGCMGNIIMNVPTSPFVKYLQKLKPLLQKSGYVGQISINCIFSHKDGQPYGLEFTPRMGWDAQLTELAILKKAGLSIAEFYISIATKQKFGFPSDLVGCGIRVYTGSISLDREAVSGRFFSFKKEALKNLWFYSVSLLEGSFTITDNPVLLAQAVAPKLPQAIQGAYAVLEQVTIPDSYYRMEIGQRAAKTITFLHKYKWL